MVKMLAASNVNVKHIGHFFNDNVRMTLQERINELFAEWPKKKNAQLARFVGVSRTTPTDWRSGKTDEMSGKHAYKVAEFFDNAIEPRWVQSGEGPKYRTFVTMQPPPLSIISNSALFGHVDNVERGPDINGKVPLISNVQAGMWAEIIDNFHVGDAEDWVPTTARIKDSTFALRVVGDSMVNPAGFPSLPPGVIVIVDPERQPCNNDIVIARLEDSMEATIKRLVIDGNQKFLKPLNPHYPVIAINGNCTIVGVAVKVEFDL